MIKKTLIFAVSFLITVSQVSSQELIAHWTFDEGNGNIVHSEVNSPATDGIFYGAPNNPEWELNDIAPIPGNQGALLLDGKKDSVALDPAAVIPDAGYTITAWFKVHQFTDDTSSMDHILFIAPPMIFPTPAIRLGVLQSFYPNRIVNRTEDSIGNVSAVRSPDEAVIGEWTHVAATLDSVSGLHTLYVNGSKVDEKTLDITWSDYGFDSSIIAAIGYSGPGAGGSLQGLIDDLAIWNESLSEEKITQIAELGVANAIAHSKCSVLQASEFSPPMGKKKKLGSTLPVKFQLFAEGTEIAGQSELDQFLIETSLTPACPEIVIYDVSDEANTLELVLPEDFSNVGESGELGSCFRYDNSQWIYNLKLDNEVFNPNSTYLIEVEIGDCVISPENSIFQTK